LLVLINNFVDIYRRAHKVTLVSDRSRQAEYAHASRGRRSSHHSGDDREQAILATAERLLQERPLADFSVDDLAKGAGISRPTFYFYFQSKNAVLLSLLDQMNGKAHAALTALGAKLSGDPTAFWRARIEAFFEVSGSHRAVAVAGAAAKATNPEVRQLWSTLMQKYHCGDQGRTQAGRRPRQLPGRASVYRAEYVERAGNGCDVHRRGAGDPRRPGDRHAGAHLARQHLPADGDAVAHNAGAICLIHGWFLSIC
jgi:AcrR family transcriptional regulator